MTNKEIQLSILEELQAIKRILLEDKDLDHIKISCDGSVKKNPGGPCTVGVVVQMPGETKDLEICKFVPGTTNNHAEMAAIYEGLLAIRGLQSHPLYPIEIISDSKICINGLNDRSKLHDEELLKKRDLIIELSESIPVEVIFIWKKRNSTRALNVANRLAQELNGVENK